MVRKTRFWLKLEPDFIGQKAYGWKAVGVTQTQPRHGFCLYMELDIDGPPEVKVNVPAPLVHDVRTEADKIEEELGGT